MIFPVEDFAAEAPKPTPLFSASASACEANIWTSVNGWSVARVFTSMEQEYQAAKSSAVIADLGPLSRYAVRGAEAAAFLGRLATAPASRLEPGESGRGLILDSDGCVIDLAEVSRLSQDLFLLTTPTSHVRRLQLAARGFDVEAQDITDDVAALGVFGPDAAAVLSAAGLKSPGDSVAASAVVRGVETAARPIQFGALPGVEVIFPKDEALTIWERLVRRSGIQPIGLDAMEILRLESGAPRSGVDFVSAERARTGQARRPAEIGLPHLAPLDRGWFNGRRGLRRSTGQPVQRLVTMSIDDDHSAPGAEVFAGGKLVGRLTSCAWSPSIKRVVAFADISPPSNGKEKEITVSTRGGAGVRAQLLTTVENVLAAAYLSATKAARD
jgi:glycine cleavage system T protein (aminomethyltransferase)